MRRCGSALGQRHPQSCVLAMAAAALTCERALRHRTARLAGGNARAGASLGRLWHDVRLLLQAGPSGPVTSLARAALQGLLLLATMAARRVWRKCVEKLSGSRAEGV